MNTFKKILFSFTMFVLFTNSLYALENGEITQKNGKQVAWNDTLKKWSTIEEFWKTYAKENGGLTWKQSVNFPPYNEVKEFDLFMAKNNQGICLMEFFHTRWRRANDVRRWDDKFNDYSACSTILN